MDRIVSPVAIDLGAKYTGILFSQYDEGEAISARHNQAMTLVMPEEGGKMTWSQTSRTATRHRLRCNKRRKLAKRLLRLAVSALLDTKNILLTGDEWERAWEALCGLLNRRGYNRLETEFDEDALHVCEPDWFADNWPKIFIQEAPLLDQWAALTHLRGLLAKTP